MPRRQGHRRAKAVLLASIAIGASLSSLAPPDASAASTPLRYLADPDANFAIVVGAFDGYSKTTANTYANDTVNWFLGRPTQATVTSTTP